MTDKDIIGKLPKRNKSNMVNLFSGMKRKVNARSVETIVTPFGGSGHAILPKTWIGKKVRVTLINEVSKGL
jgi:putative transposon-encoded protein